MPTYKVLAKATPPATTDTAVYTSDALLDNGALVRGIVICNMNTTTARTFRVAITTGSTTPANSEYIVFDTSIAAKGTLSLRGRWVVPPGGKIVARSSAADVNIHAWGIEFSTLDNLV